MKELKLFVGGKIDYGNRLLSLDLVARDESGVPVNPKTAGVMQLYSVVSQVLLCTSKTLPVVFWWALTQRIKVCTLELLKLVANTTPFISRLVYSMQHVAE